MTLQWEPFSIKDTHSFPKNSMPCNKDTLLVYNTDTLFCPICVRIRGGTVLLYIHPTEIVVVGDNK